MKINKPTVSKVNWTALLVAIVNIAGALGFVPVAILPSVVTITNLVGPALIIYFRTWQTEKK